MIMEPERKRALCTDTQLPGAKKAKADECVAVKVIDKTGLDEKALRLLPQEVSCMEKLDHPNLVRLFEVIETFSTLHLVMECAGQGTLQSKVTQEGAFGEDRARHVFAQLTSALNYMHERGMVHRDVKAENIFVRDSSTIKLGDFGFSTRAPPSHLLTSVCGSPLYAAPELFAPSPQYLGQPVDLWASGVTLYFMLTGYVPFPGEDLEQVHARVVRGVFEMPQGLTPACQRLIGGLLEADVSRRFTMEDVLRGSMWLRGAGGVAVAMGGMVGDVAAAAVRREPVTLNSSLLSSSSGDSSVSSHVSPSGSARGTCSSGSDEPQHQQQQQELDLEVVRDLETIGLPVRGVDFSEEPRSSTVGTYRILLHRKVSEARDQCPDLLALRALEEEDQRRKKGRGSGEDQVSSGGWSGDVGGLVSRKRRTSRQHKTSRYCVIL